MEGPQPQLTPARRAGWALVIYLAVVVLGHLLAFAGVAAGRLVGDDPRTAFTGVDNFRMVDDTVWAGAQPELAAYRRLAGEGVTLVVDLRTGADDDPRIDDAERLATLGIDHLALPVPDGHVPSSGQVDRLLASVARTDGVVFVHCGGGVGRSTALTSAYQRSNGTTPSLMDNLAIGPHTLEQAWFMATGDSNVVVRRVSELLDAPRRAWSRLRAAL